MIFCFENMCLTCHGIQEVITQAWHCEGSHSLGIKLSMLLNNIQKALKNWKQNVGHLYCQCE